MAIALWTASADAAVRGRGGEACRTRQIEYALTARLQISDTPFGAGDGIVTTGPGSLALRVTPGGGSGKLRVQLVDYRMKNHFTVSSSVLLWSATVETRTLSRVAQGVAGSGVLAKRRLTWATPIVGHRSDGTLRCQGSGCGMPGAPPEGLSEIHIGPNAVRFAPFVFASDDLGTFQMQYSKLSHTDQPQQTTHIALAGRKMADRCLDATGD
jgi:hypothetical protein